MIGKKLKGLRVEQGLKQLDIANELGVSRSTYTQYETERSQPDLNTVSRLADYFKVSTDYLLGKNNNSTPYHNVSTNIETKRDYYAELRELLRDEDMAALHDYAHMDDESKKEIIQFIQFKKSQKEKQQ